MEYTPIIQSSTNYLNNHLTTTFSRLIPCLTTNYSHVYQNDDTFDDVSSSNHSFTKSFVVLDVIWNMGFVLVSVFVLLSTFQEKPSSPLRVWVVGYALQCLLHVGSACHEFRCLSCSSSIMKRLESANAVASSLWWAFGFYWIVAGGPSLLQDSPRLYWLAVVFLALDVFFMIFFIGVACIICVALFCCLPIVAIAYAMTIREGASVDDIRQLPKYTFHCSYTPKILASTELDDGSTIDERDSQFQLSECCICLTRYGEGAELCSLPCNHHFHFGCISKWLRINAICPLCKFNIKAKGDALV
ncbi:E3 ubiquitin-protein ligase At4g11680-like [Silene latifolia]|uniref:E3 ubiquitin-protein ligase At4g11680-like n=1 Tax=Silene latifolia TaxID=37657 RepID=UPI003D77AAF9